MKEIKLTEYCDFCEKNFLPFDEKSEHEIYIRRYVGQHGHLIDLAFHRDCLKEWLKQDELMSNICGQ